MKLEDDSEKFNELQEYLRENLDFSTHYYNKDYLRRRVRARMRRCEKQNYDSYKNYIIDNEEEKRELIDYMSINVTEFFRNEKIWTSVEDVLSNLTQKRFTRIWSAACSDGREPYSIAMLAKKSDDIKYSKTNIMASDIDERALEKARKGIYQFGQTDSQEKEELILNDYGDYITRLEDNKFEVNDSIKRKVDFIKHDLINDESPGEFNMIFCRNLLIYIEKEYKKEIFNTLVNSLRSPGYIVLGLTESPPYSFSDVLEPVSKEHRIYKKKE